MVFRAKGKTWLLAIRPPCVLQRGGESKMMPNGRPIRLVLRRSDLYVGFVHESSQLSEEVGLSVSLSCRLSRRGQVFPAYSSTVSLSPPRMASVWRDIDRTAFDAKLARLEAKKVRFNDATSKPSTNFGQKEDGEDRTLLLDDESRLAEDLAFLAAWKSPHQDAGSVSAATIAPKVDDQSLVISLSANAGVSESVKNAFERLVKVLQRSATAGVSICFVPTEVCLTVPAITRRACVYQCWQAIVALHQGRIRHRLVVKLDKRRIVVIADRLRKLIETLKGTDPVPQNEAHASLAARLDHLIVAIEAAQSKKGVGKPERLLSVVKAAFAITKGGSLDNCLQHTNLPESTRREIRQSREAREVHALANYWRICCDLGTLSKIYGSCFETLQVHALQYQKSSRSNGAKPVHAEVQLLLHHEVTTTVLKPRIIAASKRPCFLCDSFIRSFGGYRMKDSHGEVFARWTVPERSEYKKQLSEKINRALRDTVSAVTTLARSQENQRNGKVTGLAALITKAHSVVSLPLKRLATSSASTLRSTRPDPPGTIEQSSIGAPIVVAESRPGPASPKRPDAELEASAKRSLQRPPKDNVAEVSSQVARVDSGQNLKQPATESDTYRVSNLRVELARLPWVDIFLSMEDATQLRDSEHDGSCKSESHGLYVVGICTESDDRSPLVDLATLGQCRGETLCRSDGDDDLTIVLRLAGHPDLKVRCTWHG